MQEAQADLQRATDASRAGRSADAAEQAEAARAAMANALMSAQVAATPAGKPDGAAGALPRADVGGGGAAFVGLPPRDRAAVEQGQRDPVPAAYGGMVEQYYRNLAGGNGEGK